ncbi:hypothetical protein NQ317_014100 [Molorchus minor]|uniref:ATP synthase F0 subunit 8 n=1 Tax=Molorchus minor TaxID=1323400 RepID=A0ABQ9IV19_9CUCU|nr:hypothetical protein NQ317_014100 [Molorchus minor]
MCSHEDSKQISNTFHSKILWWGKASGRYFLLIMIALVGECAIYALAWAWPNCVGLGLGRRGTNKSPTKEIMGQVDKSNSLLLLI